MIEVNFNCSQYNRSSSFDQSITFVKFLESIGIFLRIFLKISISITTNRHSHFDSRRRYAWNLVHQIRRPPPSIDSHILNLIFSPCQPRSSHLSFFFFSSFSSSSSSSFFPFDRVSLAFLRTPGAGNISEYFTRLRR